MSFLIEMPPTMDWIAFFIGLVGLYYNGRKDAVCWLIFIGSSACWLLHWTLAAPTLLDVELAAAVMSLVTIGVNWRNYRKWCREGPDLEAEARPLSGR